MGSPDPQLKGPHQSRGVCIPKSRGHITAWESLFPTQGATPKEGSPYPQLKGPHHSNGVRIPNSRGHTKEWDARIPNSRGHTKAWKFVSPTQGATPRRGRLYHQLKGPQQSTRVGIPNSKGHTKGRDIRIHNSRGQTEAWEPGSPTQGATPKRGTDPQLKGPDQSVGVRIANSSGHTKAWESVSPAPTATPKRGSPYRQLQSVGCPYPQLNGSQQSAGVRISKSRGHTKAWKSLYPTQGATPKRASLYPQLKRPHQRVGVRIPNSRGHTKGWELVSPTQGSTPKR